MFNLLASDSKKVLQHAYSLATYNEMHYVTSYDILNALITLKSGVGYAALSNCEVNYEKLINNFTSSPYRAPARLLNKTIYNACVKNILEAAVAKSSQLGSDLVGTEHLLLGILDHTDCSAYLTLKQILQEDLTALRTEIFRLTGTVPQKKLPVKEKKNWRYLFTYSKSLNDLAYRNKLSPVIGRSAETDRLVQILTRKTKNNPIIVGEAGVGKTALVELLAQRIVNQTAPPDLADKDIHTLDLAQLIAGTKYRGQFEDRIRGLLEEVTEHGNVVLFIDEIHMLVGAGNADGAIDASNLIKPHLARGDIQVIGATTLDEYRKYIEKDAALTRRFQQLRLKAPGPTETFVILKGLQESFEKYHRVTYTDLALNTAVNLAGRYYTNRNFPDKAIDIIDEAATLAKQNYINNVPELRKLKQKRQDLKQKLNDAVQRHNFEEASAMGEELKKLDQNYENLKKTILVSPTDRQIQVDKEQVYEVVSKFLNIPINKLTLDDFDRLGKLDTKLKNKVVNQESAIDTLVKSIRNFRLGLRDQNRPAGVFLFIGPSGVGKTYLTQVLASELYNDTSSFIRLDMSEFMDRTDSTKILGSPPGYVGYDKSGVFERVRFNPYCIILLDEVEKAHPDVLNIFLQIFDYGTLRDSNGHEIDFKNTTIIMTSNLGAQKASKSGGLGFGNNQSESVITKELEEFFRPEFLNRVDKVITFRSLAFENLIQIFDLEIKILKQKIKNLGINIKVTPSAKKYFVEKLEDRNARELKRLINDDIEQVISEKYFEKTLKQGQTLVFAYQSGELTITIKD